MHDNRTNATSRSMQEREEEIGLRARALTQRLQELETSALGLRSRLELPTEMTGERWAILDDLETLGEDIRAARSMLYEMTASAIGGGYTAADIEDWCERVIASGNSHPRFDRALLRDLIYGRKLPEDLVVEGEGLNAVAA